MRAKEPLFLLLLAVNRTFWDELCPIALIGTFLTRILRPEIILSLRCVLALEHNVNCRLPPSEEWSMHSADAQ